MMAVLTSLGLAWAQAWNHGAVSPIGPLHWGTVTLSYATCGDSITGEAGMKQSPIDIVPDNALAASFSAPLFKYKPTPLKIENSGHYVEMPCDPTSYLYAGSQPTDVYQLARFHFHAPSEHTINVRDDAELHLSHTNVIESAAPPRPQLKPAPPTPIAMEKQELGEQSWDPQWDETVERALSPGMLSPRIAPGVRSYCPRFASMSDPDKRVFWAYTFQALAGAEAGLKPTTDVRHTEPEVAKVDTVTKRIVHQQGLLQLAYMDAVRYGCDFNWQHDRTLPEKDPARTILQAENNLLCGVKIMENQMLRQKKALLSSTSYWETLRPATIGYKVFAKQMKNVPAACSDGMPPEEKAKTRQPGETPGFPPIGQ
jgi:Eukaryotic-type carbonic anhydrase